MGRLRKGDLVEYGEESGTLHKIGITKTNIILKNNLKLSIPNRRLFALKLKTKRKIKQLGQFQVSVVIGDPKQYDLALREIKKIIYSNKKIVSAPRPSFIKNNEGNKIQIITRFWTEVPHEIRSIKTELNYLIHLNFGEKGIFILSNDN